MNFSRNMTSCPRTCRPKFSLIRARLLQQFGPLLKRPRADTLNDSRHANMKELRFNAADGVWRVAFAFDPKRKAILLVAGDKSGVSEKRFYKQLIDKADERFDAHLARLNRRKGNSHAPKRERHHQRTEPRPSQEGRGPRGPAHRRGNDLAGLAAPARSHSRRWRSLCTSGRTACRRSNNAATFCFPRCGKRSRRWAAICPLSRSFPTGTRSSSPALPKTTRRSPRAGSAQLTHKSSRESGSSPCELAHETAILGHTRMAAPLPRSSLNASTAKNCGEAATTQNFGPETGRAVRSGAFSSSVTTARPPPRPDRSRHDGLLAPAPARRHAVCSRVPAPVSVAQTRLLPLRGSAVGMTIFRNEAGVPRVPVSCHSVPLLVRQAD